MTVLAVSTKPKLSKSLIERKLNCIVFEYGTMDKYEDVLVPWLGQCKRTVELDGYIIRLTDTTKVTLIDNLSCMRCDTKATHYAICRYTTDGNKNNKKYNIAFFHLDDDFDIVVHTKDHIVPKSQGGVDSFANYQNLCFLCNQTKADDFSEDDVEVLSTKRDMLPTKTMKQLVRLKYKEKISKESSYKHVSLTINDSRSVDLYRGKIISKNSISVLNDVRLQQLTLTEKAYFGFNQVRNNVDKDLVLPWYLKPFKKIVVAAIDRMFVKRNFDEINRNHEICQHILNERNGSQ